MSDPITSAEMEPEYNVVSSCCGASATGGGDELGGTGRCAKCGEHCSFVTDEDTDEDD